MAKRSFSRFVEQDLGKFPHFLVYAVLEWFLIILLFVDGFLAFVTNEFAKLFELQIPCLFCTRIDHVLVHRNHDFYYNESVCEAHKKDVSSLAYCHNHKKLSDIRKMCEACLLSFATEKESDCGTYKSLVGILHKDLECFVEDDHHHIHLSLPAPRVRDEAFQIEKSDIIRCSCCGEFLKTKTKSTSYSKGRHVSTFSQAPAPSPRAPFSSIQRPREVKLMGDSEFLEEDNGSQAITSASQLREEVKAAMVPLLTEADDLNDDTNKTPNFVRGNRFFGIPLTDSASNSPRYGVKISRKSPLEKTEFASESMEVIAQSQNNMDIDSVLHGLKRQVRLDRKSLIALYMELDEERSASAVAANNAMAMITRLQAEKAAVQMEALQYQRMMEEQFEYDQEALQDTNDLLLKRDDEVKALEAELEAYREKYGCFKEEGFCQDEAGGDQQDAKEQSLPFIGRTESGSSHFSLNIDEANGIFGRNSDQSVSTLGENGGEIIDEPVIKDFKEEKISIIGRRKLDKQNHLSENGVNLLQSSSDETNSP
ncbi:probable myosin-binding protein 5 isoform X2 [Humulus lupulus]|uniref:probable myosin-binding protein 5 isoform X2 n=1 Tax=Humulus lupulus TaxID=3486 RepID=UPI002B408AB8|nr:probable myosin-binding protein 5 isoform X2 [Humulus lupulus]